MAKNLKKWFPTPKRIQEDQGQLLNISAVILDFDIPNFRKWQSKGWTFLNGRRAIFVFRKFADALGRDV